MYVDKSSASRLPALSTHPQAVRQPYRALFRKLESGVRKKKEEKAE